MFKRLPTVKDKNAIYDKYAKSYEKRTKSFTKIIKAEYDFFLKRLSGKKILDLGAGPGRDSLVFKNRGFQPICLDVSKSMLELCQKKGLKTMVMDIENLKMPKNSFHGVWSYCSLTTIPKVKVWKIINKIHGILKPNGILSLGLIEGDKSGWLAPDKKYDLPRYRARYWTKEIIEKLDKKFELLHFRKIIKGEDGSRNTYLCFIYKKSG